MTMPSVVIRPIVSFPVFVNQSAPSGPVVIDVGKTMLGSLELHTSPLVLIRPILPS